jgi:hypothetical protein
VLIDQAIHAARTVVFEPNVLEKVAAEQADVGAAEFRDGRDRNDVGGESDPALVGFARANTDFRWYTGNPDRP